MSDKASHSAQHMEQAEREGALVFTRIKELLERPLVGKYDRAHLQAFHRYIFQDLPHHRPGAIRADSHIWMKYRIPETGGEGRRVFYVHEDVAGQIDAALAGIDRGKALRGLDVAQVGERLARLYGDLDYAHPFHEGNSRTLRAFTRQLAEEAGFRLDWNTAEADGAMRDRLYAARDIAVLERHFPGLTRDVMMATRDPQLHETWADLKRMRADPSARLEIIIGESLSPIAGPARERLAAFWRDHPLPPRTGEEADKAFFDDLSGRL